MMGGPSVYLRPHRVHCSPTAHCGPTAYCGPNATCGPPAYPAAYSGFA